MQTRSKILIGFKSCGKTTLGKLFCAQNPQYKFIDTDDLIKSKHDGLAIGQIYQLLGEQAFRAVETKAIANLVSSSKDEKLIVATGGGAVLNPENRVNLKKLGKIIYLQCAPEVIYQRWLSNNINPNFITDDYSFENYIQDRSTIYQQVADQIINVTNLKQTEVCSFGE